MLQRTTGQHPAEWFCFVSQMRSWMPREIGGVLWFGNDDANMVAFTPIYCSSTVRPECYNTPGADAVNFSFKNAYWVCNMTSNMVYPRYSQMFPTLKEVRDSLDNSYLLHSQVLRLRLRNCMHRIHRLLSSISMIMVLRRHSRCWRVGNSSSSLW